MKRKGSDFLSFFGAGVTGHQTVTAGPEGWVVDFRIGTVEAPFTAWVGGRDVPALTPGHRWVYAVPREGLQTALVTLDPQDHPVWVYADVIAGSGTDDRGFPWTDDMYLDLTALCAAQPGGMWHVTRAAVIDTEDLEDALRRGRVTFEEAVAAWQAARRGLAELENGTLAPLKLVRAYLAGAAASPP